MLEPLPTLSTLLTTLLAAPGSTAAAAPGAQQQVPVAEMLILLTVLGLVATAVSVSAYFLGAFRQSVQGPARIGPDEPVWPTLLAIAVAGAVGVLAMVAYIATFGMPAGVDVVEIAQPPGAPDAEEAVDPGRMIPIIQLTVAVYSAAAIAGLLTLALTRTAGFGGRLGVGVGYIPRGILIGVLALIVVLPWMLFASVLLSLVRALLGYPAEAMHSVLQAVREDPQPQMIFWALLAAVVVAPLAEEILFRGLLQTSLVHGLPRLFGAQGKPRQEASAMPPSQAYPPGQPPEAETTASTHADFAHRVLAPDLNRAGDEPVPLSYASGPPPRRAAPAAPPSRRWRWTGIILTSTIFALMHEAWSIPLIFILALAFGYVYERSGNLWAAIVMHFGFNAMNVLMLLLLIVSGALPQAPKGAETQPMPNAQLRAESHWLP